MAEKITVTSFRCFQKCLNPV